MRAWWLALSLAACSASPRIAEPNGTIACRTVESCVEGTLLALRADLAAVTPAGSTEIQRSARFFSLETRYGYVDEHPLRFDPSNAWLARVHVEVDADPNVKRKSVPAIVKTESGRVVAIWSHVLTDDAAVRRRVEALTAARLRTLAVVLRER